MQNTPSAWEMPAIVRAGRIALYAYDPDWPKAFEEVRADISRTLGAIAFEAHHIGSTSVPGLCAKPKIDIDVVLDSPGDLGKAIDLLKSTERDFHGDPYDAGMWTFTSRGGFPGHRIYVCAPGTPAHLQRILFRDHLRAHPEVAETYAALKCRLVAESGGDWVSYTGGKSAFVAEVVELAMASVRDQA